MYADYPQITPTPRKRIKCNRKTLITVQFVLIIILSIDLCILT